jgi:hypothetical protein
MDEYIQADNDFRQRREEAYRFSEMTRGFGGRIHPRHVRSIHSSSQNDDKEASFRGHSIAHSLQDSIKASSGHQLQGAEAAGASKEDMGINPEKSIAYSVVMTRATRQECVRLPFRNKKRLPKQKPGRISQSKSLHTASCYSSYIREYVGNQPAASVALASHSQASWPLLPPPPPLQLFGTCSQML